MYCTYIIFKIGKFSNFTDNDLTQSSQEQARCFVSRYSRNRKLIKWCLLLLFLSYVPLRILIGTFFWYCSFLSGIEYFMGKGELPCVWILLQFFNSNFSISNFSFSNFSFLKILKPNGWIKRAKHHSQSGWQKRNSLCLNFFAIFLFQLFHF